MQPKAPGANAPGSPVDRRIRRWFAARAVTASSRAGAKSVPYSRTRFVTDANAMCQLLLTPRGTADVVKTDLLPTSVGWGSPCWRIVIGIQLATLWTMSNSHSIAGQDPSDLFAGRLDGISTLLRRCGYTGLLPTHEPMQIFTKGDLAQLCQQVNTIWENMGRVGLPAKASFHRLAALPTWHECLTLPSRQSAGFSDAVSELGRPWRAAMEELAGPLSAAVEEMNDQIEMSPQPAGEWGPAIETLGEDLLARLVGASQSSIRRYASQTRATPQDIAERLHFVAMLLADLAGSYNEFGIRRWFARPRSALDGQSPAAVLGSHFEIDSDSASAVARLASALTGAGAA